MSAVDHYTHVDIEWPVCGLIQPESRDAVWNNQVMGKSKLQLVSPALWDIDPCVHVKRPISYIRSVADGVRLGRIQFRQHRTTSERTGRITHTYDNGT